MSIQIVKRLLHEYVDSMYCEGYINGKFYELLHFRDGENRNYLVQMIKEYCTDVDTLVYELECYSNLTNVDFYAVAAKAKLIEEKSARIGAPYVKNSCLILGQACEKKHEANFTQALGWLINEFAATRKRLETCVQMHRRLNRLEHKVSD